MPKRTVYLILRSDGHEILVLDQPTSIRRAEYEARYGYTCEIIECELTPGEHFRTIEPN